MKPYVLSIFLLTTVANSAFAEAKGGGTYPIPGTPVIDYRIDQCEGTKGFGAMWYHTENDLILGLSDFCIDEEKGTIVSAEPLEGLTLTEQSRNGKIFEKIRSPENTLRTEVRFQRTDCDADNPDGVFYTLHHVSAEDLSSVSGTRSANMHGYTIPSTSNAPLEAVDLPAVFHLGFHSQAQLPQQTTQVLPENGQFLNGKLSVSGNAGTFLITEGAGVSASEASGTLKLEFADHGEISMSGTLTAKNQRLVNHEPGEWITLTAEIAFMRGHLMGAKGNNLRALGIAKGSFVDTDGQSHQFLAQTRFETCLY